MFHDWIDSSLVWWLCWCCVARTRLAFFSLFDPQSSHQTHSHHNHHQAMLCLLYDVFWWCFDVVCFCVLWWRLLTLLLCQWKLLLEKCKKNFGPVDLMGLNWKKSILDLWHSASSWPVFASTKLLDQVFVNWEISLFGVRFEQSNLSYRICSFFLLRRKKKRDSFDTFEKWLIFIKFCQVLLKLS